MGNLENAEASPSNAQEQKAESTGKMIHPTADIVKGTENVPAKIKKLKLHERAVQGGIKATLLTEKQFAKILKKHPRATIANLMRGKEIKTQVPGNTSITTSINKSMSKTKPSTAHQTK